jgi:glucokinase
MSVAQAESLNIGIDVGGTKISIGLVTARGEIIARKDFPTAAEEGPEAVIERMIGQAKALLEQQSLAAQSLSSIGIGIPGTVERKTGRVVLAPNIYWRDVPVGERIRGAFPGVAVLADQDTNVAALGEFLVLNDPQISSLYYLTISTGVGSGIILDGKLHRGRGNTAGEVGHFIVERNGLPCTCGNRGCLQMYARGPAIAAEAVRRIERGMESVLVDKLGDGQLTGLDVGRAAAAGDTLAREVMDWAAGYVGLALGNVVSLFSPDLIVLAGGVLRCGDWFLRRIEEVAADSCYPPARGGVRMVQTVLWERANVIGAGLLYLNP